MDVKLLLPFLEALKSVLEQLGISGIARGGISKKDTMDVEQDVTAMIGIIGDIRGNIAYAMSNETARKIASVMMMGMPVEALDEISRSAIGELANMITGHASTLLSSGGIMVDITPPSIIFGSNVYFIISTVQTIAIVMNTPYGPIEVNIGLEV